MLLAHEHNLDHCENTFMFNGLEYDLMEQEGMKLEMMKTQNDIIRRIIRGCNNIKMLQPKS